MSAPTPPEIDERQPDWACMRCGKRADDAEAVTLAPWSLDHAPQTISGWLCWKCAAAVRKLLQEPPP